MALDNKNISSENYKNFKLILDRIPDAFVSLDKNWCYTYVNAKAGEILNRNPESLIGKHIWTEFPEVVGKPFHLAYEKAMKEQVQVQIEEYYPPYNKWFENSIYPFPHGLSIFFKDITEKKLAESLLVYENETLAMLANGEPMPDMLNNIALNFEKIYPSAKCSILLYNEVEKSLHHGAAPSLPIEYVNAANGVIIGPSVGSCGTAAFTKNQVIVSDIENDPYWKEFKNLALHFNLKACWSTPILSSLNKVMATFAIYYNKINTPTDNELKHIDRAVNLVKIILEKFKKEADIIESEETFRRLFYESGDAILLLQDTEFVDCNTAALKMLGYPSFEEFSNKKPWEISPINQPNGQSSIEKANQNIAVALKNGYYKFEWVHTKLDGTEFPVEVMLTSIVLRGKQSFFTIWRDISDRKLAEIKIKESEQYLKTILESEPECIKMLDKNGYLLDMNPAGLQMIEADNVEMVKGKSIINIIDEQYRTAFNKLSNNVFKGNSGKLEFEITGLKGTKRWLETHAVPFKNTNGEITALLGVTIDITDKRKSEIDLKESEEKYRLLFKSNPLPVWIVNKENYYFLDVNDAALKLYKYTKEEFLSLKATQIRPKDEVEEYIKSMNNDSIVIRTSGPWTHIKKSGEIIKVEITAENILYDNILCNLVVINNITEKVKTQKLLEDSTKQLRELASYLQNIREEERKDIAREIHDELGQQLTSLKIDVSWLKKNILKDDNKYDNKFSEILLLIDSTIKSVRQISTKIRPSILDDLGLTAAVEWLFQDFTTRMRISLNFKNDFNDKEINSVISIGLYRIIQESLNNIAKHSKASNVLINIKRVNHHIHLSIKDDGVGFDTTAKRKKEKGFGLLGIKERSIIMQGTYEIFSEPNKGTEVIVKIPI